MKAKKYLPFLLLASLFLIDILINSAPIKGEELSVKVLRSDERGVTLSFTPQQWSSKSIEINGAEFTLLDFVGANFVDTAGLPQIPYHVAVVGVPIGAAIRYRIVESDYEVQSGVKVLPFPTVKKVEEWLEKEYVLNREIYNGNEPFPSKMVMIDEPAFFRDQQIARIQVAGVQYLPTKNQVVKYNRIVLQVDFVGGITKGSVFPPKSEEALYRSLMLNYEQARRWRKTRAIKPQLQKSQSIFDNGPWYRIKIQQEGMYKIDGRFLESNGINLSEIDPTTIRIYNNGGRELPRDINSPRPSGLIENAIIVQDGGDGRFERDDFILFYGLGVEGWDYDSQSKSYAHYINHYGFDNIYWLTWGSEQIGKRVSQVTSGTPSGMTTEKYQGRTFVEEELQNPLRSGLNWFGWQFATDEVSHSKSFNLDLPNAVDSDSVFLRFRFASKTSGVHRFAISINDNPVGNFQFFGTGGELSGFLVMKVADVTLATANVLVPGTNTLMISYTSSSDIGQASLDWFEIFYAAQMHAVDDELAFTVFPEAGFQTYRISNFTDGSVQLFDITEFSNVKQIVEAGFSNGSLTFTDFQEPASPKRYLALTPARYKSVEGIERIEITDLRRSGLGAEFVIITHEDFYSEALRLQSLRENGNPDNRMETEVVRISDVWNNFSGGLVDATAIRDFLRYAYENWTPRPAYVLLFGDGDYDYKNILSRSDKNWVPTFQTDELPHSQQLRELESRTTDSWYTYVSGNDRVMDLAIGRINAQSLTDAKNAVDKIIAYEIQPLRENWRSTITMVGDDELVAGGRPSAADDVHIRQTETIAENAIPECFDVEKIYLTEFPKVLSASVSGVRKPAAQEALIRQINKGTLIVNYIGHGNSSQWAHEVVFHQSDNDRVQNVEKLVFFVAATCDWALYDHPQRQSQAEELLLAENRGAIAILSSTRLVFSNSNFRFNQFYFNNLFTSPGETARIGDAFILARISTGIITNDEKFHIYGDPTLRLAVPRHEAVITSMTPDSIVALSTIEIEGEIRRDGALWSDFDGKALINTFDSKKFVQNIPEAGAVQRYFLPGNSIFRGATPVQNGKFSARFIVPKDISYGGRLARISTYFWNDETDGAGRRDNILVSSTTSNLVDTQGPELRIYFQGREDFTTGDIVDENVTLMVDVADTVSGINIAGEIGHRLTLTIDPDEETCLSELNRFRGISSIDLTDLFRFDEGDHLRGKVEFSLNFPEQVDIGGRTVSCVAPDGEDRHTLVVKAWDNSNNSAVATVDVLVIHDEGLVLKEVMNYPNPFTDKTTFTFIASRNAEVQIKIYTISGQLIRTLEYPSARSGFNMVDWDGRDADGDVPANGVYLYKLIAKAQGESGLIQKEIVGRLAILR